LRDVSAQKQNLMVQELGIAMLAKRGAGF